MLHLVFGSAIALVLLYAWWKRRTPQPEQPQAEPEIPIRAGIFLREKEITMANMIAGKTGILIKLKLFNSKGDVIPKYKFAKPLLWTASVEGVVSLYPNEAELECFVRSLKDGSATVTMTDPNGLLSPVAAKFVVDPDLSLVPVKAEFEIGEPEDLPQQPDVA